jgi:hypothetical protein
MGTSSLKSGEFGIGVVTSSSSLVTYKVGVVPSSVFGLPVVNIAEISSTMFTSATLEIFPLIPEQAKAATLFFGLPVTSVAGHWESRRVFYAG